MTAALRAVDLDPRHAVAVLGGVFDGAFDRPVKAWPPGAALVLRARLEQRLSASGAHERTVALLVQQRARAAVFGAVLAQDTELLRRQRRFPLGFGFLCHDRCPVRLRTVASCRHAISPVAPPLPPACGIAGGAAARRAAAPRRVCCARDPAA